MFGLSFYDISWQTIIWIFLAYFFGIFHFIAEPFRWLIYSRRITENTFNDFFSIFSFTALASYVLPFKLGLPFRIYLLQNIKKMDTGIILSLLTLDALLYYAGWGIAALLGTLYGMGKNLGINKLVPFSFSVIIGILLLWFIFGHYSTHIPNKIKTKLNKIKQNLLIVRKLKSSQYIASFFVIIGDINSQIFRHYAIFIVLGIPISWTQTATIVSISIFTGIISMMPMGLVGYDATLILLAQQVGIPPEQALLVPVTNRFISLSLSALLGIWGGNRLGYSPIKGIKKIRGLLSSN